MPGSGGNAGIPLTTRSIFFMLGHSRLPTTQEASLTTCLTTSHAKASRFLSLEPLAMYLLSSAGFEGEAACPSRRGPLKAELKSTPQIKGCPVNTCGRHVCRALLHTQLGTQLLCF